MIEHAVKHKLNGLLIAPVLTVYCDLGVHDENVDLACSEMKLYILTNLLSYYIKQ